MVIDQITILTALIAKELSSDGKININLTTDGVEINTPKTNIIIKQVPIAPESNFVSTKPNTKEKVFQGYQITPEGKLIEV